MDALDQGQDEEADGDLDGPKGNVGEQDVVLAEAPDGEHLLAGEELEVAAEAGLDGLDLEHVGGEIEGLGHVSFLARYIYICAYIYTYTCIYVYVCVCVSVQNLQFKTHKGNDDKVIRSPETSLGRDLHGNTRRRGYADEHGKHHTQDQDDASVTLVDQGRVELDESIRHVEVSVQRCHLKPAEKKKRMSALKKARSVRVSTVFQGVQAP